MRLVKGRRGGRRESMQSSGEKIKHSLIISSGTDLPILCPAALILKCQGWEIQIPLFLQKQIMPPETQGTGFTGRFKAGLPCHRCRFLKAGPQPHCLHCGADVFSLHGATAEIKSVKPWSYAVPPLYRLYVLRKECFAQNMIVWLLTSGTVCLQDHASPWHWGNASQMCLFPV